MYRSPELIETLLARAIPAYKPGVCITRFAEEWGLSVQQIKPHLVSAGMYKESPRQSRGQGRPSKESLTPEQLEIIRERLMRGDRATVIGRDMGIRWDKVGRYRRKWGIKRLTAAELRVRKVIYAMPKNKWEKELRKREGRTDAE